LFFGQLADQFGAEPHRDSGDQHRQRRVVEAALIRKIMAACRQSEKRFAGVSPTLDLLVMRLRGLFLRLPSGYY
jgi:hypothetical protein